MAQQITGGLAPDIVLRGGYRLQVTALHPTTGAVVADVVISDVALQVDAFEPDEDAPAVESFVPLFTYSKAQ
jgi:hypothetical protein